MVGRCCRSRSCSIVTGVGILRLRLIFALGAQGSILALNDTGCSEPSGAKAPILWASDAALKGRSSTVVFHSALPHGSSTVWLGDVVALVRAASKHGRDLSTEVGLCALRKDQSLLKMTCQRVHRMS